MKGIPENGLKFFPTLTVLLPRQQHWTRNIAVNSLDTDDKYVLMTLLHSCADKGEVDANERAVLKDPLLRFSI